MAALAALPIFLLQPLLPGCQGVGHCHHFHGDSGDGGHLWGLMEILCSDRQLLHGATVLSQLALEPGWEAVEKLPLEPEVRFLGLEPLHLDQQLTWPLAAKGWQGSLMEADFQVGSFCRTR